MTEKPNLAVEQFYDSCAEREWLRMERHKMEFALNTRALREYLPARAAILDVGGGPGRYSIHLAQQGHEVTLLDLSAANVELGRRKAAEFGVSLRDCVHGDALDLSRFADQSFDAVLLMGPLYHLLEEADRARAVNEALRVLRPGGLLFAAFITRNAFLIDLLRAAPEELSNYTPQLLDHLLTHGTNVVTDQNPGFTNAYFVDPTEVAPWLAGFGLTRLRVMASDPIVQPVEERINALSGRDFQCWADVCYRISVDQTVWGTAEHLMYIGRKLQ